MRHDTISPESVDTRFRDSAAPAGPDRPDTPAEDRDRSAWEPDVRARMVAEDENMRATEPVPVTLDEVLAARLSRDRERDAFCARDAAGRRIAAGPLEQVFADLDAYFVSLHGELPDPAA